MKTGPILGGLGCMLWLLEVATSPKAEWVGLAVGVTAIAFLVVGTMLTAAQKGRFRLGVGLSLLAVVFGIGFLIVLLIPEKRPNAFAEPGAAPNGGPAERLGNSEAVGGPPSVS